MDHRPGEFVPGRPARHRQEPHLVALGITAVEAGYKVRYFTAADLVETLYRALVDNSVGKMIDTLLCQRPDHLRRTRVHTTG
jgi:IstB-like ATP binding protein